jgi:hypothetical protein
MNLDELKPLWKSYKEQTDEHYHWSPADFEHLLETSLQSIPWYKRSSRLLINVCMSLLLITLTGC